MWVNNCADGNIMVDCCNEIGYVFGNIHITEPFTAFERFRAVGEVGSNDSVDDAFFVRFVKCF